MNLQIEKWTSDKGQQEVHYFVAGERNQYVFGINEKLLGTDFHEWLLVLVKARLSPTPKELMRE